MKHILHSIAVAIMLAAMSVPCDPAWSAPARAAGKKCLDYRPVVVTLTGVVTEHWGYGPPGWGDDPAHERKWYFWRLDLDSPICVNGSGRDDPDEEGERNVRVLQIEFYGGNYRGSRWAGRRVSMTGTLMHSVYVYQHTRVLMEETKTVKAR